MPRARNRNNFSLSGLKPITRGGLRASKCISVSRSPLEPSKLTWQDVGVGTEEDAQSGFVINRLARVVPLACFQAVGEHQGSRYRVEYVPGGGEDVAGDQFEADEFRIAVVERARWRRWLLVGCLFDFRLGVLALSSSVGRRHHHGKQQSLRPTHRVSGRLSETKETRLDGVCGHHTKFLNGQRR